MDQEAIWWDKKWGDLEFKLQITPFFLSHYTVVYNCNEIRQISFGDRLPSVGQTVGTDCVVIWGTSICMFLCCVTKDANMATVITVVSADLHSTAIIQT